MALRILQHLEQHAEFDAVRMGLDLARLRRQLVIGPGILFRLAFGRLVDQLDVGIGDGGLLQPFIDRGAALLILAFDFQRDLGASRLLPVDLFVLVDQRLVLLRVDLDFEEMRRGLGADPGNNFDRFAGRELSIHPGGGDPDALLPAAHPQTMKLRPVEQLRENPRNLLTDDARAVVGYRDAKPGRLAGRHRLARSTPPRSLTVTSGRIPASSQASSALSTASLTQVNSAFRGLSKPSRCRFFVKNSETEISR